MKVVSAQDFERDVVQADHPVLVQFSARWCGPCRALAPTLESLAREFVGRAGVVKVDVEASPELAERFRVASIPCLVVFGQGREIGRIVGTAPKAQLAAALQRAVVA